MQSLNEKDKMANYKLSTLAAKDFETIFDYGIDTFGLVKALEYQNNLKKRFDELAQQPLLYPTVAHIRQGYRKSVYGSHSIYYKQQDQDVIVIRILGQQDIFKALESFT